MGRTSSPRKATPVTRTLSRPAAVPSNLFQPSLPSPLRTSSSSTPSTTTSATASPAPPESKQKKDKMPAQKRSFSDLTTAANPSTPSETSQSSKKPRRKPRTRSKRSKDDTTKITPDRNGASGDLEDGEVEEGEVVEGDFSDLFMVDTTPAAVKVENRYVETSGETPVGEKGKKGERGGEDEANLPLSGRKAEAARQDEEPEVDDDDEEMDDDAALRLFAKEVALTSSESGSDSDDSDQDEDEEGQPAEALMLYDDEEGLKRAIQGKIVDDSSAPATGRYYKEADLTKTCVLCGEHGHTSRDCTHQQCFICGSIDEHEARSCPVALVCSACGSRGHFARDCDIPSSSRQSYGTRCSICQSNSHMNVNCPTIWRIYDTSGPKPPKRKPVLACANCGSTKDHFVDDCLLPRGHPMRYVDPSAFNRAALGPSVSLPTYTSTSSTSTFAARRRGAPSASQAQAQKRAYEEDGDDDWFASRSSGRGGSGGGGGGRGQAPPPAYRPSRSAGGGWGSGSGSNRGGSGKKGQHIHFGGFSNESRERISHFEDPPPSGPKTYGSSSSSAYRDRDRDSGRDYYAGQSGRGGYDSPRERERDYASIFGSSASSSTGGGGRRNVGGSGKGGGSGRGTPSLLDRIGGGDSGGGGGKVRRGPSYRGPPVAPTTGTPTGAATSEPVARLGRSAASGGSPFSLC
ncbi:hypothetical protein JCM11641_004801 [Rhodosporidiobolus odoratus]